MRDIIYCEFLAEINIVSIHFSSSFYRAIHGFLVLQLTCRSCRPTNSVKAQVDGDPTKPGTTEPGTSKPGTSKWTSESSAFNPRI